MDDVVATAAKNEIFANLSRKYLMSLIDRLALLIGYHDISLIIIEFIAVSHGTY